MQSFTSRQNGPGWQGAGVGPARGKSRKAFNIWDALGLDGIRHHESQQSTSQHGFDILCFLAFLDDLSIFSLLYCREEALSEGDNKY